MVNIPTGRHYWSIYWPLCGQYVDHLSIHMLPIWGPTFSRLVPTNVLTETRLACQPIICQHVDHVSVNVATVMLTKCQLILSQEVPPNCLRKTGAYMSRFSTLVTESWIFMAKLATSCRILAWMPFVVTRMDTLKSGWTPDVYYTTLYSIPWSHTIFMQIYWAHFWEKWGNKRRRQLCKEKSWIHCTGFSTKVQWLGFSTVLKTVSFQ